MSYDELTLEHCQRYRDFQPTGFDRKGAFLPERHDWLVAPVSQTRDSGELDQSNFAAALEILGGESDFVEVHRFGHWGPGWFEIILVSPEGPLDKLGEILASLENGPILDEDDLSEREWEGACEAWEYTDTRERIEILARHGVSIFAARRDEIPQGLPYFDDFYQPS